MIRWLAICGWNKKGKKREKLDDQGQDQKKFKKTKKKWRRKIKKLIINKKIELLRIVVDRNIDKEAK